MKNLCTFLLCFFLQFASAQTQDLAALATGEYLGFNAVFDQKDNLYGYVAIYSQGKATDKTKKFEYVFLDRNLNPVANKVFEGDITAGDFYGYLDFRGKLILQPSRLDYSLIKYKDAFVPSSMEVDLKENSIKRKVYYDYQEGVFKEITQPKNYRQEQKDNRLEKREKGYNYFSRVYEIKEGGFLAIEFNDYGTYVNNNSIIKFDENKKEIWRYKYNTSGDKKVNEILSMIEKDENYVYCILQKNVKKEKTFSLLVLDMKTGKVVHSKVISNLNADTLDSITSLYSYTRSLDNDKTFDDKIIIVGRKYDGFIPQGFARLMIDRKTFEVDEKSFDYVNDLKKFIPNVGNRGYVENGYYLDPRDVFFMKDGSVGILMEKLKPEGQYSALKTTDLVYIYTDKDFKISGVKVFDKEKTRWSVSDYLFSQYLNDGKDVVFFYRDLQKDEKTKEKNWNLFINTLLDGKFNQEIVPISAKDDFMVVPYVAKEGYILLREFNEKEKFNKIRLERLNY